MTVFTLGIATLATLALVNTFGFVSANPKSLVKSDKSGVTALMQVYMWTYVGIAFVLYYLCIFKYIGWLQ